MTVEPYDIFTVKNALVHSVYYVTTCGLRTSKDRQLFVRYHSGLGFIVRNFILETFSMRYVNIFVFLFVSTGLTVCYSFRLFYFVLFGYFNFVPSYSTSAETSYSK
jgi:hypothetical protein